MKLRLLNAGHQALGYFGYLAGYRYVHEACQDPTCRRFLRAYLAEATPTLRPVPGIDLHDYQHELVVRFANPGVGDRSTASARSASDRMPKFVLPAVVENLAAGRDVSCAALVVAAWAEFVRRAGAELVDARAADLRRPAQSGDARDFIADRTLFGDLADDPRFTAAYLAARHQLRRLGPAVPPTWWTWRSSVAPATGDRVGVDDHAQGASFLSCRSVGRRWARADVLHRLRRRDGGRPAGVGQRCPRRKPRRQRAGERVPRTGGVAHRDP